MNPYMIIAAGVAAISLAVGGFTFGVKYARGEQARAEQLIEKVEERAQRGAAEAIAQIQVRHTTIRQQAETVIREKEVYRDCRNDPTVQRLLDDALAGRDPGAAGDRELPATDAPVR